MAFAEVLDGKNLSVTAEREYGDGGAEMIVSQIMDSVFGASGEEAERDG